MKRKLLVAFLLAASFATPAPGTDAPGSDDVPPAEAGAAPAASREEVERLVRALGAEAWADREAATRRLIELGRAAQPALRAALASDDAEVRYRARLVLRSSLRKVKRLLDQLSRASGTGGEERYLRELVEMGDEAIDPLVTIVTRELAEYGDAKGASDERIRTALMALERIGSPRAVEPVLSLLELNLQTQQRFPAAIARVLKRCGEIEARAGLRAKRASPEALVRRNAVEVLGLFKGEDVVRELAAAVTGDADAGVRVEAVAGLERAAGGRGRRGRDPRLGQTAHPPAPSAVAESAAAELASSAILKALDDPDRQVQRVAIEALAGLGERRVIPKLRAIVKESMPEQHASAVPGEPPVAVATAADERLAPAVGALGALGDRESIPLLLPLLASERSDVVNEAAQAFGAMKAAEAVPGLVKLLDREEPTAHPLALRALGDIGDRRAFEPLRSYILNRSYFGPLALEAIGKIPGPEARAFLVERVKTPKVEDNEVLVALRRLEERQDADCFLSDDEGLEEAALAALEKPLQSVRVDALRILAKERFLPAYDAIARCVSSPDAGLRYAAVEALGEIGDPRAIALLKPLVKKPSADPEQSQDKLAEALARLGDMSAVDAAIEVGEKRLKSDGSGHMSVGILYIYRKDYARAKAHFEAIIEQKDAGEDTHSTAAYNLACTHSLAGHAAEALDWLKKSAKMGFADWRHMEVDTDLDPVRDSDDYRAILSDMQHGHPADRRMRVLGETLRIPDDPAPIEPPDTMPEGDR